MPGVPNLTALATAGWAGHSGSNSSNALVRHLDPAGFFNSPVIKRTRYERPMWDQAQQIGAEATSLAPAAHRRIADLMDTTDERYFAGARANADAWQADAAQPADTTASGVLGRGLRRGAALSHIARYGEDAVLANALKGRAAMLGVGSAIRSGSAADLGGLAASQEQLGQMRANAANITSNAWANFGGTLAGMGLGAYQSWMASPANLSPINVTAQRMPVAPVNTSVGPR